MTAAPLTDEPSRPDESVTVLSRAGREGILSLVAAQLGLLRSRGATLTPDQALGVRELLLSNGCDVATKLDGRDTEITSSVCTASEAASRLGISTQAVRKAIASGALRARRASAGGPYVLSEAAVATYERKRRIRGDHDAQPQETTRGNTRQDPKTASRRG